MKNDRANEQVQKKAIRDSKNSKSNGNNVTGKDVVDSGGDSLEHGPQKK